MLFNRRQGMRFIAGVHEFWYRATDGLIGGNLFGTKVLLLTTTGRRSGKRHTTPLTYVEDGENLVIIASNAGAETDPNWWRNLKASPDALVQVGGQHKELHAEAASGAERERLWSAVTARLPVYGRYQGATKREIPVVVLRRQITASEDVPGQRADATNATVAAQVPTKDDEAPSAAVAEVVPKTGTEVAGASAIHDDAPEGPEEGRQARDA